MRRIAFIILALMTSLWLTQSVFSAEHGGKEHGGKEHAGKKVAEPSANEIHQAMETFISEKSKAKGAFEVYDTELEKTRKLTLTRVHERVGKTGDYYYSCADFKDMDTGELLDLDLDVENKGGKLSVVEVRIHKVDGKERYTYDSNDNRIPIEK